MTLFLSPDYNWERSGSSEECLIPDGGATGLSLTIAIAFCPLARHITPSIVLVQPKKNRPFMTEILLMGRKESNQTNKLILPWRSEIGLSPPVKYFTDRSKVVLLLWIFYVFSVLCLLCLCTSLFICALWSPAGKGLTSPLWCITVSLSLSHWYPGSGAVPDCVDS